MAKKLLIGLGVVVALFAVLMYAAVSDTGSPKTAALARVKLDYTWEKAGFDNVMIANFTVRNPTKYRIKDLEITCNHFAPSGTEIDKNVRTIYESVPPNGTRRFNKFNMGLILGQVKSSSCNITDLVVEDSTPAPASGRPKTSR